MAPPRKRRARRAHAALLLSLGAVLAGAAGSLDAEADGGTRSLTIFHTHTNETATITFKRNGRYDAEGLRQLDWILRDWRNDKAVQMDPRLFDTVWEAYRETGSREPVNILSAYRSPETNAMLHDRSKAVSEHSQHMLGRAMDIRLPDVDAARLRAVAMRMQEGGVGFYASQRFVHIDVGSVRSWPRMAGPELARLFPDGKTVHLPARGGPLPGYELAKAEILARGGVVAGEQETVAEAPRRSLWATLFGGADDEDVADARSAAPARPAPAPPIQVASAKPALPPLPPRRAPAPPELPPARFAGLAGDVAEARGIAEDERSGIRVLFASMAVAALARVGVEPTPRPGEIFALGPPLDQRFSTEPNGDLSTGRFSGPAVRPLALVR